MTDEQLYTLLQALSLEEKAFQLSQAPGPFYIQDAQLPGTEVKNDLTERELAMMGSTLYVCGSNAMRKIQSRCVAEHPHHIPMLFMMDVIHGYRTVFPIPLGMSASFCPENAEEMMRIAASEASAEGVHVAFSPMLDLVRDPRWGRVMESPGEDPCLNSAMGMAMVQGLQGGNRNQIPKGRLSSCIKHFAAYGAPEGGRDYQNVELSEHTLRDQYLPAYRAAIDAGTDMVMSSFQTINGLPTAANPWLLQDVLRKEWGFDGVVITDWAAIAELVHHGICADLKEAAYRAFQAGVDIDMCSMAYHRYLPELVREGKIQEVDLDRSVLRVLRLKNKLGLFENPYKDTDSAQAAKIVLCPEHRAAARKAVASSLVLLKNQGSEPLLPLRKNKKIALIGPYVECRELHSAWAPNGNAEDAVSIRMAADELSGFDFTCAAGCRLNTRVDLLSRSRDRSIPMVREGSILASVSDAEADAMKAEAVQKARQADCAVLFLGEHRSMSGEGASRGEISLLENQMELLRAVSEVNSNIVTVIFSGRPLDLREVCRLSQAVVMAWLPGTEGGHGIMDVLTGKGNFSGKLPMSVPYSVGQIPVSYNQLRTGRPKNPITDDPNYCSAYIDMPNAPLFPFGYGLSYSRFEISPIRLSDTQVTGVYDPEDGNTTLLTASVDVQNCSNRSGALTVQLYLRDNTASLARPVRELKAFQRVSLTPGQTQTVCFPITPVMLSFTGRNGRKVLEAGSFTLWIGADSDTGNSAAFTLYE